MSSPCSPAPSEYWQTLSLDLQQKSPLVHCSSQQTVAISPAMIQDGGGEGDGTDLSQWLHTLGSSGLRGATDEMKPKTRSHSKGPLDIIVLFPPSYRGQKQHNSDGKRRWLCPILGPPSPRFRLEGLCGRKSCRFLSPQSSFQHKNLKMLLIYCQIHWTDQ